MANDSRRLLQTGALVIPIILAATGGKMAVNAARLKIYPSASLPTPQELDSLRGYVVRTAAPAPPSAAPTISAYAFGGSDPFSKVTRWEAPKYLTEQGLIAPGRLNPARWIVSTIMITETRRVAVVNGLVAWAGSVLPGGARILSIEPDHVVIAEPGGARREVSVQGGAN
jgi:hypothetical protein